MSRKIIESFLLNHRSLSLKRPINALKRANAKTKSDHYRGLGALYLSESLLQIRLRWRYQVLPNATRIDSPLTPLDSSDARNAIISPTSSGVATRPGR